MLAMQYGFDFPDDFDLDSVRKRISEIGARFDGLPGLHLKAFLVGACSGAAPNRYAPFYLWNDPAGMTAFLTSDSFSAVAAKYGRPKVRSWSPIAHQHGPARAMTPTFATQQFIDLRPNTDLVALAAAERDAASLVAGESGLHTVFVGLDPHAWQLTRTALWSSAPQGIADARTFELRYLATGSGY